MFLVEFVFQLQVLLSLWSILLSRKHGHFLRHVLLNLNYIHDAGLVHLLHNGLIFVQYLHKVDNSVYVSNNTQIQNIKSRSAWAPLRSGLQDLFAFHKYQTSSGMTGAPDTLNHQLGLDSVTWFATGPGTEHFKLLNQNLLAFVVFGFHFLDKHWQNLCVF